MEDRIYKVAIIDDDEVSINMLQFELSKYADLSVIGLAKNGLSGIKMLDKKHPDLLFLDVELPDMKGMEVLNRIKPLLREGIYVIFYTAYDKYVLEALRNQAFDFLLKPIDEVELQKVLDRFRNDLDSDDRGMISLQTITEQSEKAEKKFMIVTPTGDLCFLRTSEIGFFRYQSDRKIWEAVLSTNKVLPLKRNITADHLRHFDDNFIQVHQSFIINLNYLMMVQDGCCVLYPPFEKETGIVLSKKYRKEMMERFYTL